MQFILKCLCMSENMKSWANIKKDMNAYTISKNICILQYVVIFPITNIIVQNNAFAFNHWYEWLCIEFQASWSKQTPSIWPPPPRSSTSKLNAFQSV